MSDKSYISKKSDMLRDILNTRLKSDDVEDDKVITEIIVGYKEDDFSKDYVLKHHMIFVDDESTVEKQEYLLLKKSKEPNKAHVSYIINSDKIVFDSEITFCGGIQKEVDFRLRHLMMLFNDPSMIGFDAFDAMTFLANEHINVSAQSFPDELSDKMISDWCKNITNEYGMSREALLIVVEYNNYGSILKTNEITTNMSSLMEESESELFILMYEGDNQYDNQNDINISVWWY